MKYFNKHLPLTVVWKLTAPDGSPYDLSGISYTLHYKTSRGVMKPIASTAISADGDAITWTFTRDQLDHVGVYSLRLSLSNPTTGKKISDITYENAFALNPDWTFVQNDGTLATDVRDNTVLISLVSIAEYGVFTKDIPLYAGADGYWYFDGNPVKDNDGNFVQTTHTVEYDPETFLIYVDKGKVDPDGVSQEIVIDAFVNVKQTTEEAKEALAKATEALEGAQQVIDEALYSGDVEQVESESDLVNASVAAAKAVNDAEAAIRIANDLLQSVQDAESSMEEAERLRVLAETARTAAETARSQAESARAEAETLRAQAFNDAQTSRQQAFEASQTARTNTFNASEQSRANTFAQTEAAREQATAIIQQEAEKLTELERKTNNISAEEAETEVESIDLYNNDKTDLIFHLDNDGADIKNLKSNGKNVATEDNLESKQDKLKEVEAETQPISDNEIVIKDDSRNEVVGINKEGLRVKNIYNLAGKPFMGIVNEVSIYVKKNGGGDFTSVVAALKSIEGKADTIYNVYVHEGIYDMVSDWFGSTSYNSASLTYAQRQGVVMPRNTNIIGVGRKGHIILKGEFPSDVIFATSLAYSTINMRGYDNKIENVTITCFNARYAVHDQVGTECLAEYEHNFVNCDFIHKGFDAGAIPAFEVTSSNNDSNHRWGSPHALGQGTNNTAKINARYASFRCESSYGVAFLTHDANNASNLGGSHIVFDCCKFENTKANGVISISSLGANTDNTLSIKDCYFPNVTPEIGGMISSSSVGGEFIYHLYGNKTNPNLEVSLPSGYDGNNWLR